MILALALLAAAAADSPSVETLMENSHWKRARAAAEAAYKANPSDARVNFWMARVRHEFGALDDAVKFAETAVKLDPKVSAYHRALGEAAGDQAQHVSFFKQIGMARKVKPEFDTAYSLDPKNHQNILNLILYYTEAPGIVGGDKKKARQIADDEVRLDPSYGYLSLVYIALQAKEYDKLEGLHVKAAEANSRNYDAQIAAAQYYVNGNHVNFAKGEQYARAANEANPDRMSAYRILCYALASQNRLDEALKVVARAEGVIPDDISPNALVARGLLLANSPDLPKAEGYLKKYLNETKEPEHGATPIWVAHWWLGLVYEKLGRKPEAIGELETASRGNPQSEAVKKDLKRLKP